MKNNIYLLYLTFLAMLGLGSCDENETPVYDAQRMALNIWFGTDEEHPVDSITYNYSYAMEEGSETFYARVSGLPTDYDRTFTLEAVDGDIDEAEGSYRVETYTIPAGSTFVECKIFFDTSKLKDETSFSETDGHLYFRIAPNNEFNEGAEEFSELVVVLKNYLAEPDNWNPENVTYPYTSLQSIFGDYSKEKYQFMIDVLGMMEFAINQNASVPYDEETNEVSYNYATYMRETLRQALNEYNATHEEPLTDASGALITF